MSIGIQTPSYIIDYSRQARITGFHEYPGSYDRGWLPASQTTTIHKSFCQALTMTTLKSHSPEDHEFAPRRLEFEIEDALGRDWHGGNAFRTAWFNALSTMFPIGEKFFIDSVRYFRDDIEDPRLRKEITAFQGQEAVHRLEHQRYNETLCRLRGYDLEKIEAGLRKRLDWARQEIPPRQQLAGTVAYEHLTAILANDMLKHDDVLRDADPRIARLWLWHGVEETEHKSVAFDVYTAVGGTTKERRIALFMNSWFFFKDAFRILWHMLKVDGKQWQPGVWFSGLNFLLGKPGVMRRPMFEYFAFYRKRFHPWDLDNRELIENWSKTQPGPGQP